MTVAELKLSRALHVRRHRFASGKLARVQRAAHTDDAVTAQEARAIYRLERRVREERALVDRRDAQLAAIQVGRGALFLPGVERVSGHHAGTFVPSPPKLVWHTTEGSSIEGAIGAYRQHNSWPHFTLDPNTGRLVQHLPMNRAGRSLEHRSGTVETNRAHAIQVELVGLAQQSSGWSSEHYEHIARLARQIETAVGVPRRAFATFTLTGQRLTDTAWLHGAGHCGHQHVPHNSHTDPGALRIDLVL
jgi:hypothetical protein